MPLKRHRPQAARDLLRELLDDARRQAEREKANADRLRVLVRAGGLGGLSAAQLAEASGLSRPGVYEVRSRRATGPVEGLEQIVLASLGAAGPTTRTALVEALGVSEDQLSAAIDQLVTRGAVSFGLAGYEGSRQQEILILGPHGEAMLGDELERTWHRRPAQWVAYLAVTEDEGPALLAAAENRFGSRRVALLPESVRRDMESPELAITFDVGDAVELFNAAADAWHELRNDAALVPSVVRMTAFSAPRLRSEVLEAFGRGISDAYPHLERQIMRAVADAAPEHDEMTVCTRALTEAAWALRQSVDQDKRPSHLADSEAAFRELQPVAGLPLDAARDPIKKALVRALEIATDRFGPFPAGRLSERIAQEVRPTREDLIEVARASGSAVGYAHAATSGKIDAVAAINTVTSNR
jgi:DNA-binding MarR family transcriptional regulator